MRFSNELSLLLCLFASVTAVYIEFNIDDPSDDPRLDGTCRNKIPHYEELEYGVDATKVDIFSCPEIGGKKAKIFNFTRCAKKQKWKNLHTEEVFDVPDFFNIEHEDEESSYIVQNPDVNSLFCRSFYDCRPDFQSVVDFFPYEWKGAHSMANSFAELYKMFLKNYGVITRSYMRKYAISVTRRMPNEEFYNAGKELPLEYESDPMIFIRFIERFGTHFVRHATYGGLVRRVDAFSRNSHEQFFEPNYLTKNIKELRNLGNFADVEQHVEDTCNDDSQRTAAFLNADKNHEHRFYGGVVDVIQEEGYERWSHSVNKSFRIISLTLNPVSMLIPLIKKGQMDKAIRAYMARAYLEEVSRELLYQGKKDEVDEKEVLAVLEKVDELKKTNNYFYNDIMEVVDKLKEVIAPIHGRIDPLFIRHDEL